MVYKNPNYQKEYREKNKQEKACSDRRYYLKNKERVETRRKRWLEDHKEQYEQAKKSWYLKNKDLKVYKDKVNTNSRNRRQNDLEKHRLYDNNWRKENIGKVVVTMKKYHRSLKGRYATLKGRHNKKWSSLAITLEEYLDIVSSKRCAYCGEENTTSGIDRVDSSKGYEISNVVSCCPDCNYMKRHHSKNKFLDHIKKIYENNFSNSN